jgi:hypothetical protein
VVFKAPTTSHDRDGEEVQTARWWVGKARKAGRKAALLLWRHVSTFLLVRRRLSGDFLPKQMLAQRLRHREKSLFVCFDCDSLSEELKRKRKKKRNRLGKLKRACRA